MSTVVFGDYEWDDTKAAANVRKHGVTFEEASTVFADVEYLLNRDPAAPNRFIAVGFSRQARVLVVVHVVPGQRTRIISARRATISEEKLYAARREP